MLEGIIGSYNLPLNYLTLKCFEQLENTKAFQSLYLREKSQQAPSVKTDQDSLLGQ